MATATVMATSGKAVTKAGNAALTDGSPAALEKFLTTDQFTARLEDMRVEASKLLMLAGPEVQKYANRALSGTEAEVELTCARRGAGPDSGNLPLPQEPREA